MSEAAKGKLSVSQVLAEADALRKRARPESSEKANAFVQTNVFAQIILEPRSQARRYGQRPHV
jgi:hypothetical protein